MGLVSLFCYCSAVCWAIVLLGLHAVVIHSLYLINSYTDAGLTLLWKRHSELLIVFICTTQEVILSLTDENHENIQLPSEIVTHARTHARTHAQLSICLYLDTLVSLEKTCVWYISTFEWKSDSLIFGIYLYNSIHVFREWSVLSHIHLCMHVYNIGTRKHI